MILYTDGGYNKQGGYGSFRIEDGRGTTLEFRRMNFPSNLGATVFAVHTNNEAEYAALFHGLKTCEQRGYKDIVVYTDSMLMTKQVRGEFKINKSALQNWVDMVNGVVEKMDSFTILHVPRQIIVAKLGH